MSGIRNRVLAAAVFGCAAVFIGVVVTRSSAQEAKAPDLSDLRDAITAASKRGENVDEVRKAFDALDKLLARGWAGRQTEPPAELTALRAAVEAAARKGENVEAVRKELDAVETKLVGRVLVAPKPLPPAEPPPARPNPPIRPGFEFPRVPFPPNGGGLNPEDVQKAQELMLKAIELSLKNPNDPDAAKLMDEARALMMKALGGGGLGNLPINPIFPPDLGVGRLPEQRARLGVRLERVNALAAEQLGLEAGRGVGISSVVDGSVADKVGFKASDIVLEFAGKPVTDDPSDFVRQVNDAKAGEKFDAVVLRKGKKVEIKGIELPDLNRRDVPRDLPRIRPNVLPGFQPLPFPG